MGVRQEAASSWFLKYLHPSKSKTWIIDRYYKPNITGQSKNRWILTDPKEHKQITKMSWIPIVRHTLIKFRATPYDACLNEYFENRDEKEFDRNCIKSKQKLAEIQNYKCSICRMSITDFSEKQVVKEKYRWYTAGQGNTIIYNWYMDTVIDNMEKCSR